MRITSSVVEHHSSRINKIAAIIGAATVAAVASSAWGVTNFYTGVPLYPLLVPVAASTVSPTSSLNVGGYPQTTFGGQTVGAASSKALLWTGAWVAPIPLNPLNALSSDAVGTDGTKQVGWATLPISAGGSPEGTNAEVWTGSAKSAMNLNPVGYFASAAYGVNGNQVVGYGDKATVSGTGTISTGQDVALVWPSLASASPAITAVNLNPTGFSTSAAYGTDTANQVGYGIPTTVGLGPVSPHALLWSGTPSSAVDLNPTGFAGSYANGVAGTQEVGYGFHNGQANALLWSGTADSFVNLNPITSATNATVQSYAEGTNGRQQVGWDTVATTLLTPAGAITTITTNATLWYGTASSAVNLNLLLPTSGKWTNSQAYTIDATGRIYGTAQGTINGRTATYAVEWVPQILTPVAYSGATTSTTWDISNTTDFTSGSSTASYQDGDSVSFGDTTTSTNSVTLVAGPGPANNPGYLSPSDLTVSSANNYSFTGAGIAGVTGLTKSDTGTLEISNPNTYTGPTNINQGTVILDPTGSISNSVVTVGDGTNAATLTISAGTSTTVQTLAGLNIASTGNVNLATSTTPNHTLLVIGSGGFTNIGTLDLANNALDIQSSDLPTVTAMVAQGFSNGTWTGQGITSSTAAADSTHLTAIGVIANTVDGTNPLYGTGAPLGPFDGTSPAATDILVKFTYYGDANLDGKVDGSDYSLIDNAYLTHATGWYNGDFNYDGVIDGSDYTLIDNAFNSQGVALTTGIVASSTAQIAGGSTVPEPSTISLLVIAGASILSRRNKIRSRA